MSVFDWINTLSKPQDDSPITKEMDRWEEINESFKRGDHIAKTDFEGSSISDIVNAVEAINEKLEIEHQARLEADRTTKKQADTDRKRFVFNAIIGIVSAVAAVTGAIFAAFSFFS